MDNELFSIAIDAAKQNYQSFMRNVWTALGSVMVAMGWILTSESARELIIENSYLKWILICILSAFLLVHIAVLVWHKYKSNKLLIILTGSKYAESNELDSDYLNIYSIPVEWIYITSIMNGALFLVLIYILCKIT